MREDISGSAIDWKWKDILCTHGPASSIGFYLIALVLPVGTLFMTILNIILWGDIDFLIATAFWLIPSYLYAFIYLATTYCFFKKRNFVGNNLWFYFDKCRQINVVSIFPRNSDFSPIECAIVIPLGGWFNKKPMIWYGARYKFDQAGACWGLKSFRPHVDHVTFAESMISIINRHGEKIDLQIFEALRLIRDIMSMPSAMPPRMPFGMEFHRCHCSERLLQDHNYQLLGLLAQTVISIAETKRFGKSKEGARIREQLAKETLRYMPEDDSRRERLESLRKVTAA